MRAALARIAPARDNSPPDEPIADEPMEDVRAPQAPAVPRHARRQDYVLAVFIAASLIVHAAAILPSLIKWDTPPKDKAPQEIPVELVQAPPPETPKPPPKAVEKPQPKKAAAKSEPKPAPKQQAAKQEAAKHEPPKPQQTAKVAPKPPPALSTEERMRQLLGMPPPGMEARALPGASDSGGDNVSYSQLVLSQVAKAKKEGRFRGIPGAASVAFLVGDRGELVSVAIKRPSGDPSLDNEALAMIHRAAPFPPPPPGGRRDFTVTLVFRTT